MNPSYDRYREQALRRLSEENARLDKVSGRTTPPDRMSDEWYAEFLLHLADRELDIDRLPEKDLRPLVKAAIDYVNRAEDLLFTRRTTRIAFWPTETSLWANREALDLLRADLTELGHEAVVEPLEEGRGAGVDPASVVWIPVYVWIAQEAGRIGRRVIDQLVSEVATAVIKRFRDSHVQRVTIYGPRNQILAEVDLEAERRKP
jgi:hypothetical protein